MKTKSGKNISKIGIGSFGIGGRGHRDVELTELQEDQIYIDALTYTLNKGINFTEISLGYGHGNAMRLFKSALDKSDLKREDIFLTHSFYTRDLPTLEVIRGDLTSFYRIMETSYADSTLVTESLILKFGKESIYKLLHELLESGKTRYVSLSNASDNFIRSFKQEFGDSFFAHEGHLSFEIRTLQDKNVFQTCNELNVVNIIWRPLRRNKTLTCNWPLLQELALKYKVTQSQVILNWMCHLGYFPMVLSLSQKHIDENIGAVEFEMSDEDYSKINNFRPQDYHPIEMHWDSLQSDDDIVALCNEFESHLK